MKVGFRMTGKAQELPIGELCRWASEIGFEAIDLPAIDPDKVRAVNEAGLEVGTVDLPGTRDLLSKDPDRQQAGIQTASEAVRAAADAGCRRMFCVFVPEDHSRKRADSFAVWKETFPHVVQVAEEHDVRIAVEGWPGPGPHYPALACTPEMWRAMFEAVPSSHFGLNYDPSHLVRIGIDYLRALDEFADRVIHAHGKDTDFDSDRLYEHGNLGPTFRQALRFSESWWRYSIPGDGVIDWRRVITRLEERGYTGIISVELEDYRYDETWELQADGLTRSLMHLDQWVR